MLRAPENPAGKPLVCYVTHRKAIGAGDTARLIEGIRAAAAAGVDWVQIREKDMAGRELLELVRAAIGVTQENGSGFRPRVIVNDRLDVALAAGADGVHLGGESLPAADVIRWRCGGNAPADFLVGVSCHSIGDAREAESAGASYIFFGPVFETPAKVRFGAPQGIAKLAEVCRAVSIPAIAIGGVNGQNAHECIRAGAAGIAAIRLFQETRSAAALREAITRLRE